MFKNKFFLGFILIAFIGILYYSLSGGPGFEESMQKTFADYKNHITTMEDSPIKGKGSFDFFEPNKDWLIDAGFQPSKSEQTFEMIMTDSTTTPIKLAGEASFEKDGKKVKLLIFDEESSYLLPFRDLTCGKGSYGGGRYINVPKDALKGDRLSIDFNMARNFYCAYNEAYICPMPPVQNQIPVEVNAGEKNYLK